MATGERKTIHSGRNLSIDVTASTSTAPPPSPLRNALVDQSVPVAASLANLNTSEAAANHWLGREVDLNAARMPIAIIGMAMRLPGNVNTAEEFWELVSRSRDAWTLHPKERFNSEAYLHGNPEKKGTFNAVGGYYLQEDLAAFDAPFFNMTKQEATSLDPQQRLLLETTYEAFENAGMPKKSVIGQNIACFVGGSFSEYELNNVRDTDTSPPFQATGCAGAMQANRISYYFDLRGSSNTVDTACSSSLTAMHLACQSLRTGESSAAIAAGVHLNMLPDYLVTMSSSRLFSDTGRSHPFDHRGTSGFARGEGVACLILKPLEHAIRDNDAIRGVIVNSGTNQDGRTNGITQPNGAAQEALMRQVYKTADVSPIDCGYVEAHGTGTKVGDPIEATALHNVFGEGRTARNPLFLGSVKSNIGHTEATSGIASVIKACLMLEKGFVLPNANFEKPNPNIPLADWNIKVLTSQRPWPRGKRFVSVNNFGFGGANAHAIIEKAPRAAKQLDTTKSFGTTNWRLFVLSANDEDSLKKRMKDLGFYLEQRPEVFEKALSRNLAYTLGERRSHLPWKLAVAATSSDDLGIKLATGLGVSRSTAEPKLGFVFTGQGAQWYAMGRELIGVYPVFTDAIYAADECLRNLGAEWSLVEELQKAEKESIVGEAHISQPACSAIQIALTLLLRSWSISPSAVTGHSSGEIGAAFAAGYVTLEEAMTLAYQRGRAIISLKKRFPLLKGAMMAVGASAEEMRPLIQGLKSGIATVACINSPTSVTISGDAAAVNELQAIVEEKRMFNRKLRVDVAYHSKHMNLVAEEYKAAIDHIIPQEVGQATFHSSLLGRQVEGHELGADYWVANLTNPVKFTEGLGDLCKPAADGTKPKIDVIVELGPHAALEGPVKQILKAIGKDAAKLQYVPTLVRNKDAVESLLNTAAALFMKGHTELDFAAINNPIPGKLPALLTDLPRYSWNHSSKYWHQGRISEMHKHKRSARHDILGSLADYSNDLEPTWRNIISADNLPWLRHHKMSGMTVFPLSGYISMAIEAAAQRAQWRDVKFDRFEVKEITVFRPLVVDEGLDVEATISLRPYQEGLRSYSDVWDEFRICSWQAEKGWLEHARGLVAARLGGLTNTVDGERQIAASKSEYATRRALIEGHATEAVDVKALYETLSSAGAGYGATFQGIENGHANDHYAVADIITPDTKSIMPLHVETKTIIHPALLDIFIQLVWPIFGAGRCGLNTLYMPSSVRNVTVRLGVPDVAGSRLRTFSSGSPCRASPRPTKLSLFAASADQPTVPLITMDDLTMTPILDGDQLTAKAPRELCYKVDWHSTLASGIVTPTSDATMTPTTESIVNSVQQSFVKVAKRFVGGSPSDLDVAIICKRPQQKYLVESVVAGLKHLTSKAPWIGDLNDTQAEGKICIVLSNLADQSLLKDLSTDRFEKVQKLLTSAAGVLWIVSGAFKDSNNPDGNMAIGLTRSIRSETLAQVATLDLDPSSEVHPYQAADMILDVFSTIWISEEDRVKDMEFLERGGELYVPRVTADEEMNTYVQRETQDAAPYAQPFAQENRRLKIAIKIPGALDTLHFVDETPTELKDDEIEIDVKATGMNFKDIVIAMGQVASNYIGVECAGVVAKVGSAVQGLQVGDRVSAMSEGAYSTYARCKYTSAAKIKDSMSFETACTIPVVYCTAYYGLYDLGRLSEGESVLIHAAAGGVGQASIMLAQMVGAEIFCTVGSADKKAYIMAEYGIPEDHIFYSRDISFGPALRRATNGRGVDVIINSLAGDILRETWECLAHFGRFIEIGKRDIVSNSRLEMARFEYNMTFASVDLTLVAAERPKIMKRLFANVMSLMTMGSIRPIGPITTYPISEVESAFRALQSGKAMGKLVVVSNPDDQVKAVPAKVSKALLRPNATYVLIGGTGGLGRSMTRWMADKGARNIALLSRSGKSDGAVGKLITELAGQNVNVTVHACDVANRSAVERLVGHLSATAPPIRGVVHGAMVLHDVLFEKMAFRDWQAVVLPKVAGAWNFHDALHNTPLDFFVTLSSVAGTVGNRGQAAYAAANTFLDAFVQYRIAQGMPATSIDLTAVTGVGYLADNKEREAEVLATLGGETVNESEVLALLGAAINGKMSSTCNNLCITGLNITPGTEMPFWADDARFETLKAAAVAQDTVSSSTSSLSIAQAIKQAKTQDEGVALLGEALIHKLSAVLMVPAEDMDPSMPIAKLGLDSLVAIEVRNWITRELEANLQVLELLTASSITALATTIIKKSKMVGLNKEVVEDGKAN